jgi:predicted Zn-ribbon and HTH transcriptional regulator
MEDKGNFRPPWQFRGGRSGRGRGTFWRDERFQMDRHAQGGGDERRGINQEGRPAQQHWRQRDFGGNQGRNINRDQHFDLRDNLNQGREQTASDRVREENRTNEEHLKDSEKKQVNTDNKVTDPPARKTEDDGKVTPGICRRCGKIGHKSEECFKPLFCPRCKKEGHITRACPEILPWECIAPFCGLAAPELGFHVILDEDYGEAQKDMATTAIISIKEGEVNARQVEGEFKAQAGPSSTWRWFAKKISENKFQIKFPTAQKVEELSFFTGMEMRTVPGIKFKVEKWNPFVGAKAEIETAWFRIFGIPAEKRTEKRAAYVASLVRIPLEVDKTI